MRLDCVEARVVEALPWLVVRYADLDRDWLVAQAKPSDLQNALGFVMTLRLGVAERDGAPRAATAWTRRRKCRSE